MPNPIARCPSPPSLREPFLTLPPCLAQTNRWEPCLTQTCTTPTCPACLAVTKAVKPNLSSRIESNHDMRVAVTYLAKRYQAGRAESCQSWGT